MANDEKFYGVPPAFSINLAEIQEEEEIKEEEEVSQEEVEEEKEELEETEESTEEQEEDDDEYAGYSEAARIALQEIKDGTFELDEKLIPKDLDVNTLRKLYSKNNELRLKEELDRIIEDADETSKYVKYLLQGGDVDAVKEAIQFKDLLKLNPEDEEDQKKLISQELKQKGLNQDEIDDLVDNILDKGKGKQRALAALENFKKYEQQTLDYYKEQQEIARAQEQEAYQEYVSDIKSIIDKGEVSGIKLDKKDQKQLFDAMFTPSEIITYKDESGKTMRTKVTKLQALQNELNTNKEKIVAFALWLLKDGNFKFAKEQGKVEEQDNLLGVLRGTKVTHKKEERKGNIDNLVDALTKGRRA